ncbi:hypothetical protein AGLY_016233 [Aphis glycines]|uniref:Tf2-1-like SH3-like domain-containing protein n=1 Tax=Aphis glycines TaxID=307491 RepID=A0A6G0SYW6_APHGL|nr:hypothetical protein AGLY_016233 [Aphis glycines]
MCLIWVPLYIIQGLPRYPQVPVCHLHLHPLLPTHCVICAIPCVNYMTIIFYRVVSEHVAQPLDNKIIPNIDNFNLAKSLETLQEIRKEIPNIIRKEQQTQKLNYDKTHKTVSYLPGQKVLMKFQFQEANKSKKIAYRYRGPFKIIKKIFDVNYEIELILNGKSTTDVIHVQRIKPFTDRKKTY